MATINLGNIKFNWKGTYAAGTAYAIDDVVSYNGSSYIAKTATTGNLPTVTANWDLMSQKGTDADLLNISSTAQGDIYYNNGSAIARLGAGTNGQALITGGTGANPSWGTISSGTYSVHAIDSYGYNNTVANSGSRTNYVDIAGGNTVSFTPTSTNDYIVLWHYCSINFGNYAEGFDVYLNMGTSSSLGSSNTKLNYNGQHATYYNQLQDSYTQVSKTYLLPCTSLSTSTTYYVEQAAANHNGNSISYNNQSQDGTGYTTGHHRHSVNLIHYKRN